MPSEIVSQSYGKSSVRVSHIRRDGDRHTFIELSCSIELAGDFDAAYTAADNSLVVPTDTIKNTVYALAGRHGIASLESFAQQLASHFIESFAHVDMATVTAHETPWRRMHVAGAEHPHSFSSAGDERRTCEVTALADGLTLSAGLSGLKVLKTTGSAFTGYLHDEFTTLEPTDDRIFATTIDAVWPCGDLQADWTAIRERAREQILTTFADHPSESVQHTLLAIGDAVLAACPEIASIHLTMPNQHHLLANLAPFGLENHNQVFVPTDEPFGNISATVGRGPSD